MADTKISALTDGTSPQTTDQFVAARAGANVALSWSELMLGFALASGRLVLTTGDITSTSASFVDLTGVTLTLTTKGHPCLVGFSCICNHTTAAQSISFDLAIDGTRQGGTAGLVQGASTTGMNGNPSFTHLTGTLSAASHTFKIQWSPGSATGKVFASATAPAVLWVAELPI